MRKFVIVRRRMRGPRRVRTRVRMRVFIIFIVLAVLAAIGGRWIESHFEPRPPPQATAPPG
jgi:hypothetical protein